MKWYKITRKDGNVQYATKDKDVYFIYGSGFGIVSLDAVSVEPIEGFPPDEYKKGYVYLDNKEFLFRAIVNKNSRWNGWEKPFIHESSIEKLCDVCNVDEVCFTMDKDILVFTDLEEDNYQDRIERTKMFDGEWYYYLGNIGYCFEFSKTPY